MLLPRFAACLTLTGLLTGASVASAQDYPTRPIRIYTGGAGGGSDMQARLVARGIAGPLGQPVIVENRAAILAAEAASKAPPDGYSLIVGGGFWRHKLIQKVPYDGVVEFSPISLMSKDVNVIAVNPSVPANSIKELITLAKSRPGELNYATPTVASTAQLGSELFKSMAGLNMLEIPYKNSQDAITGLVSGQVHMLLVDAFLLVPLSNSGKVKALAVTSAQPSTMAPGLPTVAASGLPGYESMGMTGILAPARTPPAIINRLNLEVVKVLRTQEAKDAFFKLGSEASESTPEQFAAMIQSDLATATRLVNQLGIKPQ